MRVLLSDTWASGGASTFVATLARGLAAHRHEVDVLVGYRDSPAVLDYEPWVRRVYRPPVDFTRLMLDADYDVLHVTEDDLHPPFDYLRRVRRLGLRVRVVVTSHQEHSLVDPGPDVFVYVSEAARRVAPGVTDGAHVVPNGVDVQWLHDQADESLLAGGAEPAAVWVGRIDDPLDQKDFRGFGYAIEALLRSGWRVLVLDGAPPAQHHPAEQQLRRWFGDGVTYANQVPHGCVTGALRQAGRCGGAFVSTSRYEAAPFIALESLAVGCPVVVPRISGFERLLAEGHATGYSSLAELLDVLSRRSYRSARTGVPTHLSAERMVSQYLDLYAPTRAIDDMQLRARAYRAAARVVSRPGARSVRALLDRRRR